MHYLGPKDVRVVSEAAAQRGQLAVAALSSYNLLPQTQLAIAQLIRMAFVDGAKRGCLLEHNRRQKYDSKKKDREYGI